MTNTPLWLAIVGACGGAVTILGMLEKVISLSKTIRAPAMEIDRRISSLEMRVDKHDRYFDADKQRIQDLESALSIIMQSQLAILGHLCSGDKSDTGQIKTAQTELQKYLTLRGIKV